MEQEMLEVIYVEPMQKAKIIEIENTLEAKQKLVGGYIEVYMPFEDEVAIICHDEGKIIGLPPNREIVSEDGHRLDIIAGPFLLTYAPMESADFLPLPEDLKQKYLKRFEKPELFYRNDEGNICVKKIGDRIYRKGERR